MNIFCFLHMYPPLHNAGSEVTVHAALRYLAESGHSVTVFADRTPRSYFYEGVDVLASPRNAAGGFDTQAAENEWEWIKEQAQDADILMTHLDCTSQAMQLSLALGKPLVHWIHNHAQLKYWHVNTLKCQLAIFNSHWIAQNEQWDGPQIIIHPVVEPKKYQCERGDKITFCNPTEGKGVHTVHKLAEAMPDHEFLIVEGIYGEQVAPPNLSDEWVAAHPNITHVKNDPDFRNILRQTKVLLMPSGYESYGRCAVEAACAGIPAIVHPTQGLWEALDAVGDYPAVSTEYDIEGAMVIAKEELSQDTFAGGLVSGAGIFCLRDDTFSWQAQIERLYSDEVYYRSRSDAALKLAQGLNPDQDFERLEEALMLTIEHWQNKQEVDMAKMWTPDVRLWETIGGSVVREINGRIPQDAKRSLGLDPIPEEVAIRNGLIPAKEEAKAIEAPEENKAVSAPEEVKAKRTRKKKVA